MLLPQPPPPPEFTPLQTRTASAAGRCSRAPAWAAPAGRRGGGVRRGCRARAAARLRRHLHVLRVERSERVRPAAEQVANLGERPARYIGLIATLRNLITPAPCWSVIGPSTKRPLCSSAVFLPLSITVICRPLAVI